MMKSVFKSFKIMLETMVEPIFGKDTSNYNHFEGRTDEVEDLLYLLKEMQKRESKGERQ